MQGENDEPGAGVLVKRAPAQPQASRVALARVEGVFDDSAHVLEGGLRNDYRLKADCFRVSRVWKRAYADVAALSMEPMDGQS
jgi:hypothetical protein